MIGSKAITSGLTETSQKTLRGMLLACGVFLLAGILMLPVLGVVIGSFGSSNGSWSHLASTVLGDYIFNTISLLLWVGILTGLIGTGAAWLVSSLDFPGRRAFEWMLVLPIAAPAYIIAYVYSDILEYAGPVQSALRAVTGWGVHDYWFPQIRSLPGAGLLLSFVLYPYVYLLARSAFLNHSHTRFAAARSLGATPWRAFWRVALPAARPAILGGIALALMETAADFGVVDFFGVSTFSTGIYRTWYGLGDTVSSLRLAGCLLVLIAILVSMERAVRSSTDATDIARDSVPLHMRPGPIWQMVAVLACATPVLIGFVIPIGALLSMALQQNTTASLSEFFSYARNSVSLSLLTSLIALTLAVVLAYVHRGRTRNQSTPFTSTAARLATLGYALPGTLLAVGLLVPLTTLDKGFARWMMASFNINPGLILTGTVITLVYAYTIRFLTVAYNTVEPAVGSIPRAMDEAARTLGATTSRLIRQVHVPGLRPALYSAALLVFIDTMRELPATLLLRPFNFETLATRVYRLASDERLAEASVSALALVLIGLIPVLLLNRVSKKA